jgi:adenylylsulfate kinase
VRCRLILRRVSKKEICSLSAFGKAFYFEEMSSNIHTTFGKILSREQKEKLLGQKGLVVWLTGLSGSGKTTIAAGTERMLFAEGRMTVVLDGDNVRAGINNNLGFSEEDREENIRRIAEVAKLFKESGVITFCCFVSPTNKIRKLAKEIIGVNDFLNVYVGTTLEECEKRDVKGLYAKARKGEIKDFTGINSPFEEPEDIDLLIETKNSGVEDSVKKLYEFIKGKI